MAEWRAPARFGGSYYSHGERATCIESRLDLGGLSRTTSIKDAVATNDIAGGGKQRRGRRPQENVYEPLGGADQVESGSSGGLQGSYLDHRRGRGRGSAVSRFISCNTHESRRWSELRRKPRIKQQRSGYEGAPNDQHLNPGRMTWTAPGRTP